MPIYINKTRLITDSDNTTNVDKETGRPFTLDDIKKHNYIKEELETWRMDDAINNSPIARKPINMRSKMAYRAILTSIKPTKKYLLPGEMCIFNYMSPKTQAELEYFDATPFVLFFGITRNEEGNIREVGFNLHYYPPKARTKILNTVYEVFKSYYTKYFNDSPHKVNQFINYNLLKRLFKAQKIKFGLKMYIPTLRGNTYVLPTKLVPVAAMTEGHFSGTALANVQRYWRKAKRY